ncbi:MAG: hypothetical protein OEV44_00885 [Spirochaetota bacterium]|nr:hypothetical protein [Spirochaetota bacterium]
MAFNARALMDSAKQNTGLMQVAGIGTLIAVVLLVIVGIFGGLVADGTISVPSTTNTTIQTIITAFGAMMIVGIAVFTTLFGFVLIVALLAAFGISFSLGGSKRD